MYWNSKKLKWKFSKTWVPTDLHLIFVKSVGGGATAPFADGGYGSVYQVIELEEKLVIHILRLIFFNDIIPVSEFKVY